MADIERLTSDKADLTDRLQCFEEDLKTANECENLLCGMSIIFLIAVLKMREKAISGMMAAVHRRDTDVEEREERISNLNSKA